MIELDLFMPIYNNRFSSRLRKALASYIIGLLQGLEINKVEVLSISSDGRFIKIALDGPDEIAAKNFLVREIGIKREKIGQGCVRGKINSFREEYIFVDVGLENNQLYILDSSVFLKNILNKPIPKIIESRNLMTIFGIKKFFPLFVRKLQGDILELCDRSVNLFKWMLQCNYDKIIVYGVTRSSIENFIRIKKLRRYISSVKRLDFLESIIIVKDKKSTGKILNSLRDKFSNAYFATIICKRLRSQLKYLFQ